MGCLSRQPRGFQVFERLVVAFDHLEAAITADHDQMICHFVDEISIMADEQYGAGKVGDSCFQSLSRPEIKMVGRLVQDKKVGV